VRRYLDDVDRDAFAAMREERDRHREPRRTYPRLSLARRWAFQAWVVDTTNEIARRSRAQQTESESAMMLDLGRADR